MDRYIEITVNEARMLMLEGLKFIDNICNENNIEYTLIAGTLLGAFRHGGFIPWDDDIDIGMTKENKDKFREIMIKLNSEKYEYIDKGVREDYPYELAKVLVKDSIYLEKDGLANVNFESGIFIDIFTLETFKNGETTRKQRNMVRQIENFRRPALIRSVKSFKVRSILNIYKYISKIFIPINVIDRFKKKHYAKDGDYIGYAIEESFELLCKKEDVFPLKKIEFEGIMFWAPNNPEAWLSSEYGDTYMQLPEVENRIVHSKKIGINKRLANGLIKNIKERKVYTYNQFFDDVSQ